MLKFGWFRTRNSPGPLNAKLSAWSCRRAWAWSGI